MSEALKNVTKLRSIVNVRAFGAKGDGVTNDTAAIQNALNSGSGAVFVPSGTYQIDTITVPGNVNLFGDGSLSILRARSSGAEVMVRLNATLASVSNLHFLQDNNYAVTAVDIVGSFFCRVESCYFANVPYGVRIASAQSVRIIDNDIIGSTYGVFIDNDGRNSWIDLNHIEGGTCIWVDKQATQCEGLRITNNVLLPSVTANPNTGHGIVLAKSFIEIEVAYNIIDNVDKNGLWVVGTNGGGNFECLKVHNNWFGCDNAVTGSAGMKIEGACRRFAITANTFTGAHDIGLNVDYVSGGQANGFVIANNHFFDNTSADLRVSDLLTSVVEANHFLSATSTIEPNNNSTCVFSNNVYSQAPPNISTGSTYQNNIGYVTSKGGVTGSIATGATVTHGLAVTPSIVNVTAGSVGPTDVTVSAVGPTTFTINFDGGGSSVFYWTAYTARYFGT